MEIGILTTQVVQDQQHPQERKDRDILNRLLEREADDYGLVELARLRIRYHQFPGARDIQRDLDLLLQRWQLTEDALWQKTRQIHAKEKIYRRNTEDSQQDWS